MLRNIWPAYPRNGRLKVLRPNFAEAYIVNLYNLTIEFPAISSQQFPHRVNNQRYLEKVINERIWINTYSIGHTLNRLAGFGRSYFNKPSNFRFRLKHMKICQRFIIARGLAEVTKQPGYPTLPTSSASFSNIKWNICIGYFDPDFFFEN